MITNRKKLILLMMIAALGSSIFYHVEADTPNEVLTMHSGGLQEGNFESEFQDITYKEYLQIYQNIPEGQDVEVINTTDCQEVSGDIKILQDFMWEDVLIDGVYTGSESRVTWEFEVEESGMYNISLSYIPSEGNGNDIERTLYIDGEIPYSEAKYLSFSRVWQDIGEISKDKNGNDIRPKQQEVPQERKTFLYDSSRHYNEALQFYLEKGVHTLTLEGVREPMIVREISILSEPNIPTYKEVKQVYKEKGYESAKSEPIKIQAESAYQKSDFTLYPATDRSSAATEPQDAAKIRLNSINGNKYKFPGQWITWKINVEEDGLYQIALRHKQDLLAGLYSSRKLLIDGELPFQEAANIKFIYSDQWEVEALGEEEVFEFYLTEGEHEITLEVTLGDLAPIITKVSDSLYVLNDIYRKILMITGPEPDVYRDYSFERQIPGVIEAMREQAEQIKSIADQMEQYVSGKGEQTVILDKIYYQLNLMSQDPEKIAPTFTSYKDNIAALATWILTVSEQPLSIDYLYIAPVDSELPKSEANFFSALSYEIQAFIMSFFVDYDSLGLMNESEGEKEHIEVWLPSGRDQVNILREMINDSFTPETNIGVDLKLVDTGTLLTSVLAGIGPDVSLGNAVGDSIQYAIRNAVFELNDFEGFSEVETRFHESAMDSYRFEEAVYALPETQVFPMMFYRKDIFDDLGLTVPNTWEEFYEIIPILQKNNMEIGFPPGLAGLQIFLYQNGGSLYTEDLRQSTLNDDKTIEAFEQLCELFTTYKFPRDFDFANRFRTGQMPLGIQDYTAYNQLIAFAPEIKGLWEFVPIPGTLQADGSINRAAPSSGAYAAAGSCAMIMKGSENPEASWEFLKWWTSAKTQSRFGQEMEAVLGKSAKHATANMEAIASMPWSKREYDNLMDQWNQLVGTPEVPGGYYVSRSVDFAAKTAYITGDATALVDYAKDADEEIKRKRKEFGLE